MRLYRFDADAGRPIADFGSVGLTITPIIHAEGGETQVIVMWLAPGGYVGRHLASGGQLLLVIQGDGWVEGDDGARHAIRAGQAAWWEDREAHAAGTANGMAAVVIEGDTLDASLLRPLD